MKVLVLFAHPAQRKTSINVAMAERARRLKDVTLVDLYADYPTFNIDVDREQKRPLAHDLIVFQFPIFWYSTPALLKQWQDLVLEYGFAYGPEGQKLAGKQAMLAVTTGGSELDYSTHGGNNHPLQEFLLPFRQTAVLCGINLLPPFVLNAANHLDSPAAREHISAYSALLASFRDSSFDVDAAREHPVIGRHTVAELLRH